LKRELPVGIFLLTLLLWSAALLSSCASSGSLEQKGESMKANPEEGQMQTEGPATGFLETKRAAGVDFYAAGNEPGWSLEMDLGKVIRFKPQNGGAFNAPAPERKQIPDVGVTSYYTVTESGTLTVKIFNQTCTDNMSGQSYPRKVEVTMNEKTFSGCGTYLVDNRLNDTWVLQSLHGQEVRNENAGKEIPFLAFNPKEGRMSGSTGCNRINGKADVEGKWLVLGPTASTLMHCTNAQYEAAFLMALAPGMLQYHIKDDQLSLLKEGQPVMVLKKAGERDRQ